MDQHEITEGGVAATITARGAELCSLRGPDGAEYIWQALPAWPRHAPVLFPIVGRLNGDRLLHDGTPYRLTQHGFARDRVFAWLDRSASACRLVLEDDAATRAVYPFPFRFEMHYALTHGTLVVTFAVTNTGTAILPASMGAHPAFNWPLRPGLAPEAHALRFSDDETAPIRRLDGGLLKPDGVPSPIRGRDLALSESLFAADAIVMDHVASQSVRFGVPGGPRITVAWSGFRELGLWMKPGAPFLCIEPWLGTADPVGFDGAFVDKPGLMLIPPAERRAAEMRIIVNGDGTSKID